MDGNFRTEHDSLGDMQVPAEALWGAQTQRAVENFPISGLKPWPAFIRSMAAIKLAAAEVNRDLGLLDEERAAAIEQAAREVLEGKWDSQFVVDPFQAGAGTSHNMNTNEVIANRATQIMGGQPGQYLVHPNDHVNMAQSTNDTIPTAIRVGALMRLEELLQAVDGLAEALGEKAKELDDIVKSGRTHLQDAVPVRMGQEFSGYAVAVLRDAERIRQAAEGLRRLGIGGTATGTGLNAHPEYHARMVRKLSEITGVEFRTSDNLFESMQSMADAANFSGALRTLAITLTRIANDFRLLASGPSTGLDEIRLMPVQPGSSIMPGKVNPVMCEMLIMVCAQVIGNDAAITIGGMSGNFELNVMIPLITRNLLQSIDLLARGTAAFTDRCVSGLEADAERCREMVERSLAMCTALVPRIGYDAAAGIAKEAYRTGLTVREIARDRRLLTDEELDQLLDPRSMTGNA